MHPLSHALVFITTPSYVGAAASLATWNVFNRSRTHPLNEFELEYLVMGFAFGLSVPILLVTGMELALY